MTTEVKFDDGVINNDDNEEEAAGAKFTSQCFAFYGGEEGEIETIDGSTGLLSSGERSKLCRAEIATLFLKIVDDSDDDIELLKTRFAKDYVDEKENLRRKKLLKFWR